MYDTAGFSHFHDMPIWERFVKQYFFISFCTFGITLFTYCVTATDINWYYGLSVGMSTYLLYNYYELFRLPLGSTTEIFRTTRGWVAILLSVSTALVLYLNTSYQEYWCLGLAGLLSIYYFRPFTADGKSLRDFTWFKPLTIGLVFALITAVIPYHHAGYSWSESIWLGTGRMMFLASLALVFDMGDIPDDTLQGVHTIPKLYGLKISRFIAVIMLSMAFGLELWGAWIFLIEISGIFIIGITYFITFGLIMLATPSKKWWYYLILVDGMIGLPFMLSYL